MQSGIKNLLSIINFSCRQTTTSSIFYIVVKIPFAVKRNEEVIKRPHFKGITIIYRVIAFLFFEINVTGSIYKPEEGWSDQSRDIVWKVEYALFQPGSWNSCCFISYYWKRFPVDGLPLRLSLTWYRFLRVKGVLRVLEKRETSYVEARARDSRARGLVLRETNMATVEETCDSCVVKLDPKWQFLDLRNSN